MSFGFFDKEQTGNLMSKATQDVEAVRMFISMGMVRGLSIFVMLGAVSVLMALTNWRLAIVSMVIRALHPLEGPRHVQCPPPDVDEGAAGDR